MTVKPKKLSAFVLEGFISDIREWAKSQDGTLGSAEEALLNIRSICDEVLGKEDDDADS